MWDLTFEDSLRGDTPKAARGSDFVTKRFVGGTKTAV